MWYDIWKFSHQSLQRKIFWVPQWYPYYPKNHLIHLNFWIGNISMERTNATSHANVVPKFFWKNKINSELSSAVLIFRILILDQKLHPTQYNSSLRDWDFLRNKITLRLVRRENLFQVVVLCQAQMKKKGYTFKSNGLQRRNQDSILHLSDLLVCNVSVAIQAHNKLSYKHQRKFTRILSKSLISIFSDLEFSR